MKSLVSQINFAYGSASKCALQAHLHLLGARGSIAEAFKRQVPHLDNWAVTVGGDTYAEHFKVRPLACFAARSHATPSARRATFITAPRHSAPHRRPALHTPNLAHTLCNPPNHPRTPGAAG